MTIIESIQNNYSNVKYATAYNGKYYLHDLDQTFGQVLSINNVENEQVIVIDYGSHSVVQNNFTDCNKSNNLISTKTILLVTCNENLQAQMQKFINIMKESESVVKSITDNKFILYNKYNGVYKVNETKMNLIEFTVECEMFLSQCEQPICTMC